MKLGVRWPQKLAVLFVCAGSVLSWMTSVSFAEADAKALSAQVTIRRDTFGVPHILGKTEEAAAFGHGYATAEDHVLTLGRLFLQARGEEAAYFGPKFAEADFLVKQFHMRQGAEVGFPKLAPWAQRILDGYAAGYNLYVQQHRDKLPEWVKPATGIDILAHSRRVILMEFSFNQEKVKNILGSPGGVGRPAPSAREPAPSAREPPPSAREGKGSNMWAIGKGRSASGNAILLGNPHLVWRGSQIFYESHLTVPGKLNISGTSLIGTPGVAIGFNDNLGWSHTVNLRDADDIYELKLDPSNPKRYLYDGGWLPLRSEEISIQVKTDSGLTSRKKEVYFSHHGPILHQEGAKAYAFKSPNQDEYRFPEQWFLMGKAKNLDEFRRALDMQAIPMFNICYADREGNVFYLFNGRFPDRPTGYKWSGAVPGDTSATEWNHVLPQSRLPYLVNPPGNYVQNCNSAPWYTNLQKIIDRHKFPDELTPNINGLRQQLSLEMIEANKVLSLEDVKRLKYNMKLLLADRVKSDLVRQARGHAVEGMALDEAADVLQAWDNTVARESRGGVLFEVFWKKYSKQAKRPFETEWDERKPVSTPSGIGEPDTARKALAGAVKEVKEKYGSLSIPWGEVHRLRRGNLDVAIGGLTGEYGAFRVIGYEEEKDGKMVARGGDSYVLAVEFTSPPTAFSISAYSQSDDPKSAHHTDQSILFAKEKWKRAWFSEEDIAKNLERSYHP